MRALTVDELDWVSGGGVPLAQQKEQKAYDELAHLFATGQIVFIDGVGYHVSADSAGNITLGPVVGTPGASVSAGLSNNATSIITGTSVTLSAGAVSGSYSGGAGAISVGVGTPGASVALSPTSAFNFWAWWNSLPHEDPPPLPVFPFH